MPPKIELAQAVTSADVSAPPAQKPPVDPATLAHRDLLGGEFWRAIPAYADVGAGGIPQSQVAGQALDHQHPQAAGRAVGPGLRGVRRRRPARVRARPDVRPGVALPAVADSLGRTRTRIRCGRSSSRSARASCPIIRGWTSTRCTSAPTCRSPGSPIATSTRRSSWRSTPVPWPLLHAHGMIPYAGQRAGGPAVAGCAGAGGASGAGGEHVRVPGRAPR